MKRFLPLFFALLIAGPAVAADSQDILWLMVSQRSAFAGGWPDKGVRQSEEPDGYNGLFLMTSPDGINWDWLSNRPIISQHDPNFPTCYGCALTRDAGIVYRNGFFYLSWPYAVGGCNHFEMWRSSDVVNWNKYIPDNVFAITSDTRATCAGGSLFDDPKTGYVWNVMTLDSTPNGSIAESPWISHSLDVNLSSWTVPVQPSDLFGGLGIGIYDPTMAVVDGVYWFTTASNPVWYSTVTAETGYFPPFADWSAQWDNVWSQEFEGPTWTFLQNKTWRMYVDGALFGGVPHFFDWNFKGAGSSMSADFGPLTSTDTPIPVQGPAVVRVTDPRGINIIRNAQLLYKHDDHELIHTATTTFEYNVPSTGTLSNSSVRFTPGSAYQKRLYSITDNGTATQTYWAQLQWPVSGGLDIPFGWRWNLTVHFPATSNAITFTVYKYTNTRQGALTPTLAASATARTYNMEFIWDGSNFVLTNPPHREN